MECGYVMHIQDFVMEIRNNIATFQNKTKDCSNGIENLEGEK